MKFEIISFWLQNNGKMNKPAGRKLKELESIMDKHRMVSLIKENTF
jgi:hypothetical protein